MDQGHFSDFRSSKVIPKYMSLFLVTGCGATGTDATGVKQSRHARLLLL